MLQPAHDYVVIEIQNQTTSGIVLSHFENNKGTVLAMGPEVKNPVYALGSSVYFEKSRAIECGNYIVIQDAYIVAEEVE